MSGEEDGALPAGSAPRPSTLAPALAEAHPLLDVSLTPDKTGGILRRETSERRGRHRQVRFDISDNDSGGPEAALPEALAAPRMHSSASLRHRVQRQSQQEFHAQSALHSELVRSFTARRSVESQAARALNVSRVHSLYQGLVNVEPPADHLHRLTIQHRRSETPESPLVESPDIFAFSDACERITESPYLAVDALPPLTLQSRTRPPDSVFHMFHKLVEWGP